MSVSNAKASAVAQQNNVPAGIALMLAATVVFAMQDGISRHLAETYNTYMVVMIRYWFFAAFVVVLAMRVPGGVAATARTRRPVLQILRGLLLATQICVTVFSFTVLGLIESQAVFICYPLLIAALSGPVLGEPVGWRRWAAIAVGCVGVLIILQPGRGVFNPWAVVPLASALMFALYGLLTRYVARRDRTATSFFWTGIVGALATSAVGLWFWEPMSAADWRWMSVLCLTGVLGHWLLIKCYEVAEAGAVQPFAYFQLLWSVLLGLFLFGEDLRHAVVIGTSLVVAAGLFTLWRERLQR